MTRACTDSNLKSDEPICLYKADTPGSAGTLQEIFQNAVQDHYLSFGFASPMVFLGKKYWSEDVPVYPLMQHLMETGRYKNLLLTLTDDPMEIVQVLKDFQKTIPHE